MQQKRTVRLWCPLRARFYDFGVTRVACVALLIRIALSEWRSCGVVITKFSGHAVTLRSSPTVFADMPTSRSASTCIAADSPPIATCSAATLLGLYFMWASSLAENGWICVPKIMALAVAAVAVAAAAAAV